MIEMPIQYLLDFLAIIVIIFIIIWTAFGVYLLLTKEIIIGIIVLCVAVVFWLSVLSMLKIVVWV